MFHQLRAAHLPARALSPRASAFGVCALMLLSLCAPAAARAQEGFERELDASAGVELRVRNRAGRVTVTAAADETQKKVSIRATSAGSAVTEKDVRVEHGGGAVSIEVERAGSGGGADSQGQFTGSLLRVERERIDLVVSVPARARVRVETEGGAVDVVGNVASAEVRTGTGTIRADVPLDALRYSFRWTLSRPRFFSEVELPEVKSKRGGVYEIAGRFGEKKAKREERIELKLETERGVVLFGVKDESAVPSDLRERALTEAARAIIRSGDTELIDAIRKIAPRLVGDYTRTLPPHASGPTLETRADPFDVKASAGQNLARVQARVTDRNGRALAGLSARDFTVVEDGVERAVREVTPSTAPFDLVLLLDVSGSVEERLDFIRKAALNFAEAAGPQDRLAIISFRDDVQLVSDFTSDRALLARRIKDIQAGGATALYDAIGYTLVHTLRPLRGGRTGVVILSDGDDNRSFVTFPSLLEAVVESGAVVYPLYVPSGLIPSGGSTPAASTLDPMRSRYLTLTSRAGEEGRRLAEISGGTYYPITRIEQLQKAYDDVVADLRTSYSITFESDASARRNARVRVRVSRPDASVRLSPAVGVPATSAAP
jgi:Ca-activated chloride channel family protein